MHLLRECGVGGTVSCPVAKLVWNQATHRAAVDAPRPGDDRMRCIDLDQTGSAYRGISQSTILFIAIPNLKKFKHCIHWEHVG